MNRLLKPSLVVAGWLLAACAVAQTPKETPLPDVTNSAALTDAMDDLSADGGDQSDRAMFRRWMAARAVEIVNNGMRAIPASELPATVGEAIERQRRVEKVQQAAVERNRIKYTQGICEEMRKSARPSYYVGWAGGYTIGEKNYDDPCLALRANGLPELDDSEDAVRARESEERAKNQVDSDDAELLRRWQKEFGGK